MAKAGLIGSALTLTMASSSVPSAFGLAGLSKPTWLSLSCRKLRLLDPCACASPMMPSECGRPPEIVHSTPVPAQVIHSRTLRRLTPSSRSDPIAISLEAIPPGPHGCGGCSGFEGLIGGAPALFPAIAYPGPNNVGGGRRRALL